MQLVTQHEANYHDKEMQNLVKGFVNWQGYSTVLYLRTPQIKILRLVYPFALLAYPQEYAPG